jgi:hypothetical protein
VTVYEVYGDFRNLRNMTPADALFTGTADIIKLAGIFYPLEALGATGITSVVKPAAEKVSEYVTPVFIGGMSQATGVPESILWRWH